MVQSPGGRGQVLMGDLDALPAGLTGSTSLLSPGSRLAEVISRQVPGLVRLDPARVDILPGVGDLVDGWDESYVHARLVELLDAVTAVVPGSRVVVWGFPEAAGREELRRQCDGAAAAAARVRGLDWCARPG